jgi:hypothetical protein
MHELDVRIASLFKLFYQSDSLPFFAGADFGRFLSKIPKRYGHKEMTMPLLKPELGEETLIY